MLHDYIEVNDAKFDFATNKHGKGAPTKNTEGAIGVLYLDEDTKQLYVCTGEIPENYQWEIFKSGNETVVLYTPQELTEEQQKQARENIGVTEGGGIDLGITGASIGQMAEVAEVDASGKPKKWKPIPKPGTPTDEQVGAAVDQYLTEHPVQPTSIDSTLTKMGEAADAKATGDAINKQYLVDYNRVSGKLKKITDSVAKIKKFPIEERFQTESIPDCIYSVDYSNSPEFKITMSSKAPGKSYNPIFLKVNAENAKHITYLDSSFNPILFGVNENYVVIQNLGGEGAKRLSFVTNYKDGSHIRNIEYQKVVTSFDAEVINSAVKITMNDEYSETIDLTDSGVTPHLGLSVFYNKRSSVVKVNQEIVLEEVNPSDFNLYEKVNTLNGAFVDTLNIKDKAVTLGKTNFKDRFDCMEGNQYFGIIKNANVEVSDNIKGYGVVALVGNTKVEGSPTPLTPAVIKGVTGDLTYTHNSVVEPINIKQTLFSMGNFCDAIIDGEMHKRVNSISLIERNPSIRLYPNHEGEVIRFRGYVKMHSIPNEGIICTHLRKDEIGEGWTTDTEFIKWVDESNFMFSIKKTTLSIGEGDSAETKLDKLWNWLASQNSAGTPFTFYYVLETEEREPAQHSQFHSAYYFDENADTFSVSGGKDFASPLLMLKYPKDLTKKIIDLETGGAGSDIPTLLATKVNKEMYIDPDWEGWTKKLYPYGFDTSKAMIFNELDGTIKTNGMFVSQCSPNNRWTKNFPNGGHVFEGWAKDRSHRLTALLVEKGEDGLSKACLHDFDSANTTFGWLKLGSDNDSKDHPEGGNGWDFNCNMVKAHTPLCFDVMTMPTKMPAAKDHEEIPVSNGTMYFDGSNLKIRVNGEWKTVQRDGGGTALKPLTFTGASTEIYDGTKPVTVNIPTGGGGGAKPWRLIADVTTEKTVQGITIDKDIDGQPFELSEFAVYMDIVKETPTLQTQVSSKVISADAPEGFSLFKNDLNDTAKSGDHCYIYAKAYWNGAFWQCDELKTNFYATKTFCKNMQSIDGSGANPQGKATSVFFYMWKNKALSGSNIKVYGR